MGLVLEHYLITNEVMFLYFLCLKIYQETLGSIKMQCKKHNIYNQKN